MTDNAQVASEMPAAAIVPAQDLAERIRGPLEDAQDGSNTRYPPQGRLGKKGHKRDAAAHEPRRTVKIGRNDPCPCGSVEKYKKCSGATVH